ncbi:MAG: ABC transporter substrate-binding protein [Candidatus Rokuibacteriota bacterium]|nr:MAG: ABC transporter substrate-binding protein [Candidatus Rokubacteria bacterium]
MGRPVRRSSAVPSRGDARCEPSGSPPAEARCERRRFPMRLPILTSLVTAALLGVAVPASAQTFVFGAQGEPVQLDPAVITDGISSRLTRQIFDGLVKYRGATTEVEPALAEKWEVSRDGKVWTFQLRRSVKFHDGTPLDAAAVVWNFERWWKAAHPQHDNQVKAGQTFEYWEAQFAGFDDKSIVSAVEAVGTHTVRITLKEPQAPFLANLAMFVFDIASPRAVERWGTEFGKHPVGTGAYKFVEWKPNQEVVLEANPDFWGQRPRIKRVVVRNIKDNSQRLGALKAGEIHGMEGLNPDDVGVVRADSGLQLLLRPTNTTGYIAFNYKVKEFQDKRVRQAFAHAINKRGIVEALYGGTGLVATQFQPPALWGYNRELKDYEYSPSQAQALLREAGQVPGLSDITWEDGKKEPLVFWYMSRSRPYFPNPKEIAEAMAADLAKVGIKTQLQTTEWAVYLDKRKNGQMPLYMLGWTGDNGDPDNFLCYFFCQPGAAREGFYANKPLADVLLRAQKLTQQSERAKLYRQSEQLLRDDVGRLFIANNQPPLAFAKRVKGYVPHPTGSEYFNTVELQ